MAGNTKFNVVKKTGYLLVILLVFSPLTFLVANTLAGNLEKSYCDEKYPSKPLVQGEEYTSNTELIDCEKEYDLIEREHKDFIFVVVSIISIVTILLLLFLGSKIESLISYGLFFGSALNTIMVVWEYSATNSYLALGLGLALFVLIILFINRNLKRQK